MRGRVYRSAQRIFYCKVEGESELVMATAKGNLLKGSDSVVVGDEVEIKKDDCQFYIIEVLERKSEIWRQIKRENKRKVTASNIDLLVIVSSAEKPKYKRGLVDRFLMRSAQWEIPAIHVFNKMDGHKEKNFDISFESKRLEMLKIKNFEISAKDGEEYSPKYLENGLKELNDELFGKTAIFLGQSGVGKSSLINRLSGGEFDLKTKEVGRAGKGTHTTTWSEILDFENFTLIDSPGIRSFSLDDVFSEDLEFLFPDLLELFLTCQFRNCDHGISAKGCFYNDLKDSETIKIIDSRLESFYKLRDEVSEIPDWKKKPH
jgi:ribosome biogenesis GTPase / thiamine phosphate phosphatase